MSLNGCVLKYPWFSVIVALLTFPITKFDDIDLDKLSIDHIKEVRECYDEGLSLTECCDISNLQVITMRENILKSNPKAMIY